MAYTNQTTTSLADLISKLDTFLSTSGWTTVHTPASGEWAARKTAAGVDVAMATQWDTTTPAALGLYQWLGAAYNGASSPWAQNNDSGNGAASTSNATLLTGRYAYITNTPVQFWCFEEDFYFRVVVESSTGLFRHFGAGSLEKFNDWVGGDYVYGQLQQTSYSSTPPVALYTTVLLDGLAAGTNIEKHAATVHITGMLNQPAGSLYGVAMGAQSASALGNDRQAVPKARIHLPGGFRAGAGVLNWGPFEGNVASGLLPGYPIVLMHRDVLGGSPTNDFEGPLGRMKDVRGMNIKNYAGGDELTIGSDTWVIFPSYTKGTDSGSQVGTSGYQGIVYRKITP